MPGGVNPADALLDVIGDAEAMVDRGEGEGGEAAAIGGVDVGVEGGGVCGLVVMPRELLLEQVTRHSLELTVLYIR